MQPSPNGTNPSQIYLTVNGRKMSLADLIKNTSAATRVVLDNCPGITALPDLAAATRVVLDNCPGITALPDLAAATRVELDNCPGITALPDLAAATRVELDNCPGITAYAGKDSRGYGFYRAKIRGLPRVVAGCRNFTFDKARKHWGPGGYSDRKDCLALVEKLALLIPKVECAA